MSSLNLRNMPAQSNEASTSSYPQWPLASLTTSRSTESVSQVPDVKRASFAIGESGLLQSTSGGNFTRTSPPPGPTFTLAPTPAQLGKAPGQRGRISETKSLSEDHEDLPSHNRPETSSPRPDKPAQIFSRKTGQREKYVKACSSRLIIDRTVLIVNLIN